VEKKSETLVPEEVRVLSKNISIRADTKLGIFMMVSGKVVPTDNVTRITVVLEPGLPLDVTVERENGES